MSSTLQAEPGSVSNLCSRDCLTRPTFWTGAWTNSFNFKIDKDKGVVLLRVSVLENPLLARNLPSQKIRASYGLEEATDVLLMLLWQVLRSLYLIQLQLTNDYYIIKHGK